MSGISRRSVEEEPFGTRKYLGMKQKNKGKQAEKTHCLDIAITRILGIQPRCSGYQQGITGETDIDINNISNSRYLKPVVE